MKIKLIYVKSNDEIKFTKEELESLVEEAYKEGYEDGRKCNYSPFPTIDPHVTWRGPIITTDKTITVGDYLNENTESHV